MNPLGTGDPVRLGPYRLVGVLGVGGMGKVYLGRDGGGRPAALKVLRPELAYDAGLVHRDLKPSNIVLTSGGPCVIDFGIARPEHGLTLTTTGQVPVTPGYGPPEQVLGQRVGPAADVFALGAVLSFAATGERVFTGEHVAAVQCEVVHGQPRLGGLPPELLPLLASCLEKDAGRRPAPDRLAQALAPPRGAERAWLKGALAEDVADRERAARRLTALPTDGPTAAGPPEGKPSRRRLLTALAGGGALLAAGGAGAWYWLGADESGEGDGAHQWDAKPMSGYENGKPPTPLWGPYAVARDAGPAPLPVRDVVVVAAKSGGLHAYDVRSGGRRWKAPVSLAATAGPLLISAEEQPTVLGIGKSGEVFGLDPEADGEERWSASADAAVLLAADAEAAYLVTEGGKLRALSLTSHKRVWTVRLPVRSTDRQPARAAVARGRLVVHGADGKVVGVDTANGRTVWGPRQQSKVGAALVPAVAGGLVYLGGHRLTALALADGSRKWTVPAAEDSGWGAPALDGKVLYASNGADVEARSTADGAGKWTVTLNTTTLPPDAPTVQRGTAWVALHEDGTDGMVAVDTRKGTQAWTYVQGAAGPWQATAAGNRVFLLQGGTLTAMPVF
ncbi:outer membrane protein assembly factor BamB family protein [Streptomyces sp. 8N114]|uniref:outer membrane protein assembly factor BamB family protein n=1 Tax=Streptomyces sp. 8N114 TaxID=3457419 RepID=UPI003FD57E61